MCASCMWHPSRCKKALRASDSCAASDEERDGMSIADVGTLKAYPARPKRRTVGRSLRAVLRRLRWGLSLGLVKAAFYVAKSGGRPYEPVEIGGRRFANVRDSDVRWRTIATVLK